MQQKNEIISFIFIIYPEYKQYQILLNSVFENIEDITIENDSIVAKIINEKKGKKIKLGRHIQDIWSILYKNGIISSPNSAIIEKLVSCIIAYIMPNNLFKIVEGKEILEFYNKDVYKWSGEKNDDGEYISDTTKGTLSKSCMRYDYCEKYLNIYKNNKNISMLIMVDEKNKLTCRGLLWKTDNNKFLLDRIYYSYEYEAIYMMKIGIMNDWIVMDTIHWNPSSYKTISNILPVMNISINDEYHNFFPYMDTFRFLDLNKNILTTYTHNSSALIDLRGTDGRGILNKFDFNTIHSYNTLLTMIDYDMRLVLRYKLNTLPKEQKNKLLNTIINKDRNYSKYVFENDNIFNDEDEINDFINKNINYLDVFFLLNKFGSKIKDNISNNKILSNIAKNCLNNSVLNNLWIIDLLIDKKIKFDNTSLAIHLFKTNLFKNNIDIFNKIFGIEAFKYLLSNTSSKQTLISYVLNETIILKDKEYNDRFFQTILKNIELYPKNTIDLVKKLYEKNYNKPLSIIKKDSNEKIELMEWLNSRIDENKEQPKKSISPGIIKSNIDLEDTFF